MHKKCPICYTSNIEKIHLRSLPLSETYSKKYNKNFKNNDQIFNFCSTCQHGYLNNILPYEKFYNDNYHLRTSSSGTSSKGSNFFIDFIKNHENKINCLLDIGCNDLFLLKKYSASCECIGIDPIQNDKKKNKLTIIGKTFEDAFVNNDKIDQVFCRHTLEHIDDINFFFKKLYKITTNNCKYFFEFPSIEYIYLNRRYDQIFHQHLQYFSLKSINKLLNKNGFEIKSYKFNPNHWGALLIYFKKKSSNRLKNEFKFNYYQITKKNLLKSYKNFTQANYNLKNLLDNFYKNKDKIYFYGASQMLPIIFYHLKIKPNKIEFVIDDDISKNGLTYSNLPIKIRYLKKIKFNNDDVVVVSAPDNNRPILSKLTKYNPKIILLYNNNI